MSSWLDLCVHMYHPYSSAVLCDEERDKQKGLLQIPFEGHRPNGIAQDI